LTSRLNATAAIQLALYMAVARRRGIRGPALPGTAQNDILRGYLLLNLWRASSVRCGVL